MIRPYVEHLAELGTPSRCARFVARTATDPAAQAQMFQDPALTAPLAESFRAARPHAPTELPDPVLALRYQMMRAMTVHTCAGQERSAATEGTTVDRELVAETLVDAAAVVLLAPVGRRAPG